MKTPRDPNRLTRNETLELAAALAKMEPDHLATLVMGMLDQVDPVHGRAMYRAAIRTGFIAPAQGYPA